jgi:serine/threonine protein kinase
VRLLDNTAVAVKCISTEDVELQQFAQAEYDIMSSLSHHAVVSTAELHIDARNLWMVMEICEDGNLETYRCHKGPFGNSQLLSLLWQLLEAVDYLHQKRVVHRDLKPENCLLKNKASSLKVTDFNSAKVIGQSRASSAMLSHRGTRAFFAPEVVLGQLWNERVDVWSCGIIAYFMVSGKIPFRSDDPNVKEHFLADRLPRDVDWAGFATYAAPVHSLTLQCLTVDMHRRPSAMLLLRRQAASHRGAQMCDQVQAPAHSSSDTAASLGRVLFGVSLGSSLAPVADDWRSVQAKKALSKDERTAAGWFESFFATEPWSTSPQEVNNTPQAQSFLPPPRWASIS